MTGLSTAVAHRSRSGPRAGPRTLVRSPGHSPRATRDGSNHAAAAVDRRIETGAWTFTDLAAIGTRDELDVPGRIPSRRVAPESTRGVAAETAVEHFLKPPEHARPPDRQRRQKNFGKSAASRACQPEPECPFRVRLLACQWHTAKDEGGTRDSEQTIRGRYFVTK